MFRALIKGKVNFGRFLEAESLAGHRKWLIFALMGIRRQRAFEERCTNKAVVRLAC